MTQNETHKNFILMDLFLHTSQSLHLQELPPILYDHIILQYTTMSYGKFFFRMHLKLFFIVAFLIKLYFVWEQQGMF